MRPATGPALLALALACSAVHAEEDPFDPFDPGAPADGEAAGGAVAWSAFGQARLRGERTTGLPGGREDLERLRAEAVAGLRADWGSGFSAAAAVRGAAGSDDNRDNLANNDNLPSDGVDPDQWWLAFERGGMRLAAGKQPLALALSPMLWDEDLRPRGATASWSTPVRGFDLVRLDAVAAKLDHPLGGDARIHALQGSWLLRPGADASGDLRLALVDVDRADSLVAVGLARGNRVADGRLVSGFRLLDLQFGLRRRTAQGDLEFRLDLVRNLDADDAGDGARASLVLGDRFDAGAWEFGWAWERIQADAVLAAANSDDWWFHAGMRGHMPWVGYGINRHLAIRVAAFLEHRDGLDTRTDRFLLDLEARW